MTVARDPHAAPESEGEGYAWLNAAAIEVNQVWNFANAQARNSALKAAA
jgi:hypothetical protein